MSKEANCGNRCRGNNVGGTQHYCWSSEHYYNLQKAREAYKMDKVDGLRGSAARNDAIKTFYPVNSALTNVCPLNILTSLGKLGELPN